MALINSNEEKKHIMKIVKSFEELLKQLLIKGISEAIKIKQKNRKVDFF